MGNVRLKRKFIEIFTLPMEDLVFSMVEYFLATIELEPTVDIFFVRLEWITGAVDFVNSDKSSLSSELEYKIIPITNKLKNSHSIF